MHIGMHFSLLLYYMRDAYKILFLFTTQVSTIGPVTRHLKGTKNTKDGDHIMSPVFSYLL
jgi:hypothetical protein